MSRNRLFILIVVAAVIGYFAWGIYATSRQAHLNTQLIAAVDREDAPAVERLLASGADANTREGDDPQSPWKIQLIALIKRHSLPERLYGQPVLCIAAENGDYQIVCDLIKAGADVNASDDRDMRQGTTALIESEDGQGKSVGEIESLLLKHGANINARDENGVTPLSEAVDNGNPQRVQALVQAGAKINTVNEDGDTPLMHAMWWYTISNSSFPEANVATLIEDGDSVKFFL